MGPSFEIVAPALWPCTFKKLFPLLAVRLRIRFVRNLRTFRGGACWQCRVYFSVHWHCVQLFFRVVGNLFIKQRILAYHGHDIGIRSGVKSHGRGIEAELAIQALSQWWRHPQDRDCLGAVSNLGSVRQRSRPGTLLRLQLQPSI